MTTELEIKVINNIAPVTLAKAVYMGDGTSTTLEEKLKTISSGGGTTNISTTGLITLKGGTVKLFVDITNKKISWTTGVVFTDTGKVTVNSGEITFTSSECNTSNPNNAYALMFTGTTFKWNTISTNKYEGYAIMLFHYNSGTFPSNSARMISYFLDYPRENICVNGSIIWNDDKPHIKRLAILGDSLSSGENWSKHLTYYTYIPNINCLAKSGATMSTQSSGTLNIADSQVNSVTSDTDCTIIFCGTNDGMFNATIDEFVESPTNNNTSFTKCYQYTIEKLLTLNPEMKIYLVTPMFTLGKTYGEKSITYESNKLMRDAVIKIGQYYNLPVLDLFYNSGVNKINSTTFQTDGVHGTELGYINICEKIWKFICSN